MQTYNPTVVYGGWPYPAYPPYAYYPPGYVAGTALLAGTIGLLACGLLLMAGFASRKRLGAVVSARA